MSAFLGHIHFWLYKKIQLINEREQLILKEAEKSLDDLATELHDTAVSMYGEPIPADRNLQMIIDHSNIHGWLQNQIEVTSVREATFIKDLLDCGGDMATDAILTAFVTQGTACGTLAKEKLGDAQHTPQEVYQAMQDYYLNGMPCDGGNTIISESDSEYIWAGTHQNQREHWKKAGVSEVFMAAAYQAWFRAFVAAAAPYLQFDVILEENNAPLYRISKTVAN